MFRAYSQNLIRKHWQMMILGCLIVAGLASGIVLVIHQVTQTNPPDPATAEVKQIGEFLKTTALGGLFVVLPVLLLYLLLA